jgi:predicted CXXCH cytochrome family protein
MAAPSTTARRRRQGLLAAPLLLWLAACMAGGLRSSAEPPPTPSSSSSPTARSAGKKERAGQNEPGPGPEAKYLPKGTCRSSACHGSLVDEFETLRHSHYVSDARYGEAAGCGVCHGPASEHVADPAHGRIHRFTSNTRQMAERVNAACIKCHQDTIRRPHYMATEHARSGMSCATCHEVHYDLHTPYLLRLPGLRGPSGAPLKGNLKLKIANSQLKIEGPAGEDSPAANAPKLEAEAKRRVPIPGWRTSFTREEDAITSDQAVNELCLSCHRREVTELRQLSHHPVMEGRVTCTDCHGAHHAEQSGRMLKRRTVSETCLQCHQNVRGPFVFEHEPVKVGGVSESCLECHRPHGSPNRDLTVMHSRGLCLQCHVDIPRAPSHPKTGGDCWQFGCHIAIHGSNRDFYFFAE